MNIRFHKLRSERCDTIKGLAEMVGIVRSTLSEIENGKREISTNHIEPLCKAFEVTSDYLLERSNEGIICNCSDRKGKVYLSETEYNDFELSKHIYINRIEGRCITKDGEALLSEMRSKDFDKNMLYIMQGISSNGTIKEIIPLLSQLNDSQLELILNTIKALLGK